MQRVITYSLFLIGILTGIFHLRFAAEAWFISRNEEPLSFWIFLISGPLSTLPAVLVSFLSRKISGVWLVSGSLLSLIAWMVGLGTNREFEDFMRMFISYTTPMFVLGFAFLLINYSNPVRQKH